jgi:hypothetical protein
MKLGRSRARRAGGVPLCRRRNGRAS